MANEWRELATMHGVLQSTHMSMGVGIGLFDMTTAKAVPLMNWADYEHAMERFPQEEKKYGHLGVEGMCKYIKAVQPDAHPCMYEIIEDKVRG